MKAMILGLSVALAASFATAPAQGAAQAAPVSTTAPTTPIPPAGPVPVVTLENRNLGTAAILRRLEQGGLYILMRHERTEVPSRDDDYSRPITDCMAQRNLSIAGLAGAQETGVSLRAMNIPIAAVLASPMCRSMDTARMMFGRVEPESRLLHHDNVPERTLTVSGQELNDLLAELTPNQGNHVLVSHIGNIFYATGIRLTEGEFVVLERQADGSYEALGKVDPGDISAYARMALMRAEAEASRASNRAN